MFQFPEGQGRSSRHAVAVKGLKPGKGTNAHMEGLWRSWVGMREGKRATKQAECSMTCRDCEAEPAIALVGNNDARSRPSAMYTVLN